MRNSVWNGSKKLRTTLIAMNQCICNSLEEKNIRQKDQNSTKRFLMKMCLTYILLILHFVLGSQRLEKTMSPRYQKSPFVEKMMSSFLPGWVIVFDKPTKERQAQKIVNAKAHICSKPNTTKNSLRERHMLDIFSSYFMTCHHESRENHYIYIY